MDYVPNEELNYTLQTQGIEVLDLRAKALKRVPGWFQRGRFYVTDNNGVIGEEVCEVNIEGSRAASLLKRPATFVRKADLEQDPALYVWFRALEHGINYGPLLSPSDTGWQTNRYLGRR